MASRESIAVQAALTALARAKEGKNLTNAQQRNILKASQVYGRQDIAAQAQQYNAVKSNIHLRAGNNIGSNPGNEEQYQQYVREQVAAQQRGQQAKQLYTTILERQQSRGNAPDFVAARKPAPQQFIPPQKVIQPSGPVSYVNQPPQKVVSQPLPSIPAQQTTRQLFPNEIGVRAAEKQRPAGIDRYPSINEVRSGRASLGEFFLGREPDKGVSYTSIQIPFSFGLAGESKILRYPAIKALETIKKVPGVGAIASRFPTISEFTLGYAGTLAAPEVAQGTARITQNKITRGLKTGQAVDIGQNTARQAVQEKGGSLGYDIIGTSFTPQFAREKAEQAVIEFAKKEGYTREQTLGLVNQYRRESAAIGIGQIGGNIFANTASESIGQRLVGVEFAKETASFATKNSFSSVFKKVFVPIGTAGFFEGSATVALNQRAQRNNDLFLPYLETKPEKLQGGIVSFFDAGTGKGVNQETTYALYDYRRYTPYRLGRTGGIAAGGAFGTLSAGLIGGTVAGASASKYKKSANVLQAITYATDPYELPGDLSEKFIRGRVASFGRVTVPEPAVFLGGKESHFGISYRGSVPTQTISPTSTSIFNLGGIKVPVYSPVPVSQRTPVNTRSDVNPFIITPVNTMINTNIPEFEFNVQAPSNTIVNTFINVNTPVNTNIPVPVNIPVTIPRALFPPPLPFSSLPQGGSGFDYKGQGRNAYVNELSVGGALIDSFLGGSFLNTQFFVSKQSKPSKDTSSKSGKKKHKKEINKGSDRDEKFMSRKRQLSRITERFRGIL
jgi:hypothetical protein